MSNKTEKSFSFYSDAMYKNGYNGIEDKVKIMIEYLKLITSYYSFSMHYDMDVNVLDKHELSKFEVVCKHKTDVSQSFIYQTSVCWQHSHIMIKTDDSFKSILNILYNKWQHNSKFFDESFDIEFDLDMYASEEEWEFVHELKEILESGKIEKLYEIAENCKF